MKIKIKFQGLFVCLYLLYLHRHAYIHIISTRIYSTCSRKHMAQVKEFIDWITEYQKPFSSILVSEIFQSSYIQYKSL